MANTDPGKPLGELWKGGAKEGQQGYYHDVTSDPFFFPLTCAERYKYAPAEIEIKSAAVLIDFCVVCGKGLQEGEAQYSLDPHRSCCSEACYQGWLTRAE